MLESINTLCVYPFLPLHCPTPERELSPILLKDVVAVHAYLSFNLSIWGHRLLTSCSIINFTFLYPFNLVFLVLLPPNLYGSINILVSISAVFIKILKYIQTSLSFHQREHHIWCNHIIRWCYWGTPLPLALPDTDSSHYALSLPRQLTRHTCTLTVHSGLSRLIHSSTWKLLKISELSHWLLVQSGEFFHFKAVGHWVQSKNFWDLHYSIQKPLTLYDYLNLN